MFQGTGSGVGKSVLVAGIARALNNRGLKILPFKPQNMSNNAAVTPDGGEIGRAQAVQARACRVAPSVHMNPVLLKPQSEIGAQIILQGRVWGSAKAREYQAMKPDLLPHVLDSFALLQRSADIVLVEGAGSASEINLRHNDIANMGFARATGTRVVLIGDIDRGGVIASLVGTKAVLDAADAALIQGFIVNRMRGDARLFADGMAMIAARTGWRALGLVPHFPAMARLPAEDAADMAAPARRAGATLRIAVPVLPCMANADDLDPLIAEPAVDVAFLRPGQALGGDVDLVILAGSKSTIADLAALREAGWDVDIHAHVRRGGRVLGLCGGFQMLGLHIDDPDGIEGGAGRVAGLGLLEIETVLSADKRVVTARGVLAGSGAGFAGYEIHAGRSSGAGLARPFLHFADGRPDGARSADGAVAGTYVHGIFASDAARAALLADFGAATSGLNYDKSIDETLDALAHHLETHIDIDALLGLA